MRRACVKPSSLPGSISLEVLSSLSGVGALGLSQSPASQTPCVMCTHRGMLSLVGAGDTEGCVCRLGVRGGGPTAPGLQEKHLPE